MEAVHIHKFTSFIYNTSSKKISDIFSSIPDWQLEALQDKETELRKLHNGQNRLVWLDLIAVMDKQQMAKLAKYIEVVYFIE